MLEIRIVEDAGSFETQRIWEGVVPPQAIGSRLAIEPEIASRLGEVELRVERKDGADWIDIGDIEQFLPDVCSIELASYKDDDIMSGWRLEEDSMWEDRAFAAMAPQTEKIVRQAIAEDSTPDYGNVTWIGDARDSCVYCPSDVANPGDLVCADCLQPASMKLARHCTDCDGRLQTATERRDGYCKGCVVYYDISPAVELKSRYRPFGRLAHLRAASAS